MWGGEKGDDHFCPSLNSSQIMLDGKENRALFLLQRESVKATKTLLAKPSPWLLGGNPNLEQWFSKCGL